MASGQIPRQALRNRGPRAAPLNGEWIHAAPGQHQSMADITRGDLVAKSDVIFDRHGKMLNKTWATSRAEHTTQTLG